VCRCGTNRHDLEERGITLAAVPQLHPPSDTRRPALLDSAAGRLLCGYRTDADVAPAWRLGLLTLGVLAVMAMAVAMVRLTHQDPQPARSNIHVISTLDEFTRDAGPAAANTIPAFLELPGHVGILPPSSDPHEPVTAVSESDLRDGFCSPSVVRQIRHQYPGFYDSWPDDKLERLALEKYPELRDRVCTLSYKIDATPVGVIKYEPKPRTVAASAGIWMLVFAVIGAFALACLNIYYRLLVERLAIRPAPDSRARAA
jgi:hypothetical protein